MTNASKLAKVNRSIALQYRTLAETIRLTRQIIAILEATKRTIEAEIERPAARPNRLRQLQAEGYVDDVAFVMAMREAGYISAEPYKA